MSRAGYSDDCDGWALIRWRGAVKAAITGRRGQALLREMLTALDAMPEKTLIAHNLEADGEHCALGVLGAARGITLNELDPEDRNAVADAFGIAPALVAEIVYKNDEGIDEYDWVDVEICGPMRPHFPDWGRHARTVRVHVRQVHERRWRWMRAWVAAQIKTGERT
jgi:hypothetical protein